MKNNTFVGGIRVGLWANSWPNGFLEITDNALILKDKSLKKEYVFTRDIVNSVEIKNIFPLIAQGIRIHHSSVMIKKKVFFWSFNLKKLKNTLKDYRWL